MTRSSKNARSLDEIAERIHRRGRNSTIEDGRDLLEAKAQCEHGQWLAWLEDEFDWSEDTAERLMSVARLADKFRKIAELKIDATTLYRLAAHDNPDEMPAIVAELAKHATKARLRPRRASRVIHIGIGRHRFGELPDATLAQLGHGFSTFPEKWRETIIAALVEKAPETDEAAAAIVTGIVRDGQEASARAIDEEIKRRREAERKLEEEAEALLDGPPPAVPPPASPAAPIDFDLRAFDEAVGKLKTLMTRPAAKFAGTALGTNDLEEIEGFLRAVRTALLEVAS